MTQAVSHWPLTTGSRVWYQASPCGICGGQSDTEIGFPPIATVFLSVSFHQCSIFIHLSPMLYHLSSWQHYQIVHVENFIISAANVRQLVAYLICVGAEEMLGTCHCCKDIPNLSVCLVSWQLLLLEPAQRVTSCVVWQPFRCLNSNIASITKVHRKMYARLYPTAVILPDGSSISIRYYEPRKIIKVC
jgi:hypothetical protein